jgi:tetratricopeptide (TPR) repeat protein
MNNSTHWQVLGTEATKDEAQIRAAYLSELPKHHPEDDPDGFRRLREAYEAALEEARRPEGEEDEEDDTTESGLIVRELKAVVDDFVRRLNISEWQDILNRDECARIDLQSQISEKLLILLMDDYYLPQKVWRLLNDFFGWSEQADILRQKFPSDYIDYVFRLIRHEENLRSEYFDLTVPGTDFNGIINSYYELSNAITNREMETARKLVDDATESGIMHLDVRLQIARYYYYKEDNDTAEAKIRELLAAYPEDDKANLLAGQIELQKGNMNTALRYFEKLLAENPDHYNARIGEAQVYFDMEEYEVAKAKCMDILTTDMYDNYANSLFDDANEKLIGICEAELAKEPSGADQTGRQDTIYKLASCYFNVGRMSDCLALIKDITPDEAYIAKDSELCFDALLDITEDYESIKYELLEFLKKWEHHETDRARLQYLPGKYYYIGEVDEAMEKAEEYLAEFPGSTIIRTIQTQIYRDRKQFAEAIKTAETGLAYDENFPPLLAEMAKLMHDTGDMAEAVRYAEKTLDVYPYANDMWTMIIEIYHDADYYDKVIEVCDAAASYGIDDPFIIKYKAAAILLREETDEADDREADQGEEKSSLAGTGEGGSEGESEGQRVAEISSKDTAVEALLKISETEPEDLIVLSTLASHYMDEDHHQKVIELYTRLINIEPGAFYYHSRGLAYSRLDQNDAAKSDYLKAIELMPDVPFPYYNLGFNLYYEVDLNGAIDYLLKAHHIDPDYMPPYIFLVKSYSEKGDIDNAIRIADEGIARFDRAGNEEFLRDLAAEKIEAYYQISAYKDVLAMEDDVLDEDGDIGSASVLTALATSYYEQHEDDKAEAYYKKALRLAPDDDKVWRKYAFFLVNGRKDFYKAIEYYEKAVELRPIYLNFVKLAKACEMAGEKKKAKRYFKIALKMIREKEKASNPHPCLYYFMGECYFGLKKYKNAEDCLLLAVEKAPEYIGCSTHFCYEATFLLAYISKIRKNFKEAAEYYRQTIEVSQDREYLKFRSEFEL